MHTKLRSLTTLNPSYRLWPSLKPAIHFGTRNSWEKGVHQEHGQPDNRELGQRVPFFSRVAGRTFG